KIRIRPADRVVALCAGLREPGLDVIRVGRALEIFQVAADAGRVRAGQIVVAIYVALPALRGRVRTGQRKPGGRVIEGRVVPRSGVVALLAGLRECGLDVIRVGRALEILQVTADASCVRAAQIVIAIYVALPALRGRVCTGQRKPGGRVIEGRVIP